MSNTPPAQNNAVSGDTPVVPKYFISSRGYQTNQLDEARLAVLRDLGSTVPQITLDDFMKYLAPIQPDFDIGETMESLKEGASPTLSASGRWNAFVAEPKDQMGHEDVVFKPLPDIYNAVVTAIIGNSDKQPIADFLHNPNITPSSAERKNTSKPDGYFLIRERSQKDGIAWADIVLSCEYKKHKSDSAIDDDVNKCLWSMQHIMRDDPCRRATFGLTIENTTARLWFCCRSAVIVSETFDFIAEPEALIRLFAAFAFAEKERLGFDSSIERVGTNDELIFTVQSPHGKNKFKTKRAIFMFGAEPLRGRGTRVFEVIEQDGQQGNKSVVLKDIWIDSDRDREGSILAQMLEEAKGEDKELVRKYFLTTVCHGDVLLSDGKEDDTNTGLLRGLKIGSGCGSFLLRRAELHVKIDSTATESGSMGIRAASRHHVPHPDVKYSPKTHYRIVFEEVGRTLDPDPKDKNPMTFGDIMKHMATIVSALELLHKLGWVHRDVSIGNILACEGGAKLADLEYAKKMEKDSTHKLRTGTKDFMSIECSLMRYLFLPPAEDVDEDSDDDDDDNDNEGDDDGDTDDDDDDAPLTDTIERPKFYHNYLHDLESLWWVAVWILFYHHLSKPGDQAPDLEYVIGQLQSAETLFPRLPEDVLRHYIFQHYFEEYSQKLSPNKRATGNRLDLLRIKLLKNYYFIEASLPTNKIDWLQSNKKIYSQFIKSFSRRQPAVAGYHLHSFLEIEATLKSLRLKRSREESTTDTGGAKKKK